MKFIYWLFANFIFLASLHSEVTIQSSYRITSQWDGGYVAAIDIKNSTAQSITSWQSTFSLPTNQTLDSLWGGQYVINNSSIVVKNESWNGTLQPGQVLSLGLQVNNPQRTTPQILSLTATGNPDGGTVPAPEDGLPVSLNVSYHLDADWGTGKQFTLTLTNGTSTAVNQWLLEFDLKKGQTLTSLWGGQFTVQQNHVKVINPSWSGGGNIPAGGNVTVGMVFQSQRTTSVPFTNLIATGNPDDAQQPQLPAAPLLNSISNEDRDDNYIVSWGAVPGATLYTLEESTQFDFSTSKIIVKDNVVQKSFQGQANGIYYYRVFATNASGNSSYSNIQSVLVQLSQPLSPPVLNAIPNDDLDSNYIVSWRPVDNASGYILEESLNNNFSTFQTITLGNELQKAFISKANGTYFYRVKAKNSSGVSSSSNVQSVVVNVVQQPITKKVIGYFTNWAMYRNPSFKPHDINASLVTHINYAFANVDTQGNILLTDPWADTDYRTDWNTEKPYYGNFRELYDLKQANPGLKTLISIGGWTLSDNFSRLAESSAARARFAQQCVDFCKKYDFNGIDIDWEYPGYAEHSGRAIDKGNFTLLLKDLSTALKAQNPPLLLTIAAPAGPSNLVNIEVNLIHNYLDWINLMTYDLHGHWDSLTNHQSAILPTDVGDARLNVDAVVNYYLSQGVPSQKLVLGMPLYGYSFANANSTPTGLYSSYSGPGRGTTEQAGTVFFYDIVNNLLNTFTYHWDSDSLASYLYNPTSKEFITYDSEEALALKGQYIKSHNLGGAMVWELGHDTKPAWKAMSTINNALK